MHRLKRIIIPLLALVGLSASAQDQAGGEALVPLPSVFDFTRGDGWGVALGVGVEYESAYDGSDEMEFELDPIGAVQWRRGNHLLFWEGIEAGWRGRLADTWLVQAGARYEGGREADDSEDGYLDGLEDRDDEFMGVLEIRKALDSGWRNWVAARFMAEDGDIGVLGIAAAGHRFDDHTDGSGTEAYVFATFGDSNFINHDFGVTASESEASGYPETDLDGGYRSSGIKLIHRRYFTDHLHAIGQAGAEYYSSDIDDSPLARRSYEMEVSLSLVYHF